MDDTDYAFGRTHAEYARLIEQAELFRPLTERMLIAAGIKRGMHVLDVGCGVGDVSFLVAALVGPEGSVVGVDLDAEVLKLAKERRAAKRITNETSRRRHVCCLIGGNGLDHQRRNFVYAGDLRPMRKQCQQKAAALQRGNCGLSSRMRQRQQGASNDQPGRSADHRFEPFCVVRDHRSVRLWLIR